MARRYLLLGTVAVVAVLIVTAGVAVSSPHEQSDDTPGETPEETPDEAPDQAPDEPPDETPSELQNETEFVVEQGEECTPIEPLSYENETAEDFYGYVADRSSPSTAFAANTPVGLEHRYENASSLFLYEDQDGISLVVIHDRAGHRDDGGGAASMRFSDVPREANWIVRDDPDEGDDVWRGTLQQGGQGTWTVHWRWGGGYTDGGVLKGGFGDDISVQVTPAFNDDAGFNPTTPGTIDEWQVLSGSATDPNRTSLDMDHEITMRSGSC